MNMLRAVLILAVPALLWLPMAEARAECPQRLEIGFGDTLESIAHSCGINVERLLSANAGLNAKNLQAGTFITVPRAVLPSPQLPVGRQSIRIIPSLVPSGIGISSSNTVIAPPPPPVVHRFTIPGLVEQPGSLHQQR